MSSEFSLPLAGFLSFFQQAGAALACDALASRCNGVSCFGAQALGCTAPAV